jgi:hypothetical protein
MSGLTRKFSGKVYRFYDSYDKQNEAAAVATRLRRHGKSVRITRPKDKLLPYHEVWIR